MNTVRKLRLPGLVLALACAANGAPITVIFGGSAPPPPPPPVFGFNTVTFNGTLMNTATSPVFLNAATVQVPGFGPGDFDLNPFFANAPASLAGGRSTPVIALFSVRVPFQVPAVTYTGTFTILGGSALPPGMWLPFNPSG